jgi:hypothetical protein
MAVSPAPSAGGIYLDKYNAIARIASTPLSTSLGENSRSQSSVGKDKREKAVGSQKEMAAEAAIFEINKASTLKPS